MAASRFSSDAIGRVAISFLAGIIIGNLLWVPYAGALVIALIPGGIFFTSPLALVAAIIAALADEAIKKHLILWSVGAALAVTLVYALFDPPVDRVGVERVALALTCSMASAVTFFFLTKRATRGK